MLVVTRTNRRFTGQDNKFRRSSNGRLLTRWGQRWTVAGSNDTTVNVRSRWRCRKKMKANNEGQAGRELGCPSGRLKMWRQSSNLFEAPCKGES